jgi:hypothetical protein
MTRKVILALLWTILALLPNLQANAQAQKVPWFTAYYGTWNQETLGGTSWNYEVLGQPPDQLDWTGITHVVHFGNGNVVAAPPYSLFATDSTEITYGAVQNSVDYQKQLISVAHSHGVKVCLSIQAVDPAPLNAVAADSLTTDVFANWIILYAKRHNYDGIELDWEGSVAPTDQVSRIVRRLRYFLDAIYSPTHAFFVMSPGLSNFNTYAASQDWCIDQYNVQMYAMMWTPNDNNLTWHECAVYPGTTTNGAQGAIDALSNGTVGYLQQWINAGHDPAKMGLGLPTFGYLIRGADGLFQSTAGGILGHNGNMTVDQNKFCTGLQSVGGQMVWDNVRKMHYITGTATAAYAGPNGGIAQGQKFFATVASAQWIQEVVKYAKTKNYGGYMLYSLTEDLDPSKPIGQGRNIIHDALRDALAGVGGQLTPIGPGGSVPLKTALEQNFPNPFNPSTVISYQISAAGQVSLIVYDVLGREVQKLVNSPQASGAYSVTWNAAGHPSGVYLIRLKTGNFSSTKRMVLLR